MLRRIQDLLNTALIVIIRPTQNHSSTMQLTSPISSENLMQSRLGKLGLQISVDVGGAGDCFFRSVSHQCHQLYGNSNHHMRIHTAGVKFMRDNRGYLNNMSIQGTWTDALIIQIVESYQGFAPLTIVYPVQERNHFIYNYYRCWSY